jgi:hypothetical protein
VVGHSVHVRRRGVSAGLCSKHFRTALGPAVCGFHHLIRGELGRGVGLPGVQVTAFVPGERDAVGRNSLFDDRCEFPLAKHGGFVLMMIRTYKIQNAQDESSQLSVEFGIVSIPSVDLSTPITSCKE